MDAAEVEIEQLEARVKQRDLQLEALKAMCEERQEGLRTALRAVEEQEARLERAAGVVARERSALSIIGVIHSNIERREVLKPVWREVDVLRKKADGVVALEWLKPPLCKRAIKNVLKQKLYRNKNDIETKMILKQK